MIIEADRQTFGIPMDLVVETVRLPAAELRQVKDRTVALLRGQIVPLIALHDLLALSARPQPNVDGEYAILVVRVGAASVGLIVDAFAEVVDVILKPLPGALSQLPHYAGAALLGDGSVLLILNPKALIA
ncbi:MAG: chemotaxis protein CheW [Hydrogenophilus sp.]|nr:chemotaxis protein CheW [Hydrogenophilus sp.]